MSEPTGVFAEILDSVDATTRELIYQHLVGGTSTVWLSEQLSANGLKISPTTLKEQRVRLKNG